MGTYIGKHYCWKVLYLSLFIFQVHACSLSMGNYSSMKIMGSGMYPYNNKDVSFQTRNEAFIPACHGKWANTKEFSHRYNHQIASSWKEPINKMYIILYEFIFKTYISFFMCPYCVYRAKFHKYKTISWNIFLTRLLELKLRILYIFYKT